MLQHPDMIACRSRVVLFLVLGLCWSAATPPASASGEWTVINLHPNGATSSAALAIEGGQQVGYANFGGGYHASLWSGSAASWVSLGGTAATSVHAGQQGGYISVFMGMGITVPRASAWSGSQRSLVNLHPAAAGLSEPSLSIVYGVGAGQQVGLAGPFGGWSHASLWTDTAGSWVDLNPLGSNSSEARATDGSQQVGHAHTGDACLWSGTAASWVNLHPQAATLSYALGIQGGQQVGYAVVGGVDHASLWTGTAASWVDLQPANAESSQARGVHGGQQVGWSKVGGVDHAGIWSGTAASWVDLNSFLPSGFDGSRANGIWHDGPFTYVVGEAKSTESSQFEAVMWVQSAPCASDLDGSSAVDVEDLLAIINAWGPCPDSCPPLCAGDIAPPGGDCAVGVDDLLAVISSWGACP